MQHRWRTVQVEHLESFIVKYFQNIKNLESFIVKYFENIKNLESFIVKYFQSAKNLESFIVKYFKVLKILESKYNFEKSSVLVVLPLSNWISAVKLNLAEEPVRSVVMATSTIPTVQVSWNKNKACKLNYKKISQL